MKYLTKCMIAGLLILGFSGAALAVTPEEARTRVQQHAADKGMEAKEVSQAVSTLERLMSQGVPVDHAYAVVKAAIDDGIRGTDLAEIARAMERERRQGVPPALAADRALAEARGHIAGPSLREEIISPTRGEFGPRGVPGRDFGIGRPGGIPGGVPTGQP